MEVSKYLVSWIIIYLRNLQPTYIGVIIDSLSTMDIPGQFSQPAVSQGDLWEVKLVEWEVFLGSIDGWGVEQ